MTLTLIWNSLIPIVRSVLGDRAAGITDAMLEAKIGQLPIRLAFLGLLAWFLLKRNKEEAVHPQRVFIFNLILAALGIYYTLDLFGYLMPLYSFGHPCQLGFFARLFMGSEVDSSALPVLEGCTLLAFFLSILRPGSTLRLIAILAFALSESLVYAYGYSENTFTSFRLAQWFLFLYSTNKNQRMIYFGQVAVLLCYILPGIEKLLSFAFGLLDGDGLKIYAEYFHLNADLFRLLFIAGLALQLSMLAALRYRKFRRLAPLGLISFHIGTAALGVGGITTPWTPALLILLI